MKEICIINYTSNAAVYGIGTYIREYAHCLEAIGCTVNLIELGTDKKNTNLLVKERGNVREIHLPYLQGSGVEPYNKGVCRLLRLYIQDSEQLVFHYHYCQSESLLDEVKKYFPLSKSVFTIHYLSWSASLQGNSALFEQIIRRRNYKKTADKYGSIIDGYTKEKTFWEKIDHLVCLSDDTYKLVRDVYEVKSNLWLIPNGLRKNFRRLSDRQKKDLREKYHIRPDEKILLFVGRIHPIKGIYPLLSCFDKVLKEYPDCRLVVIGDGSINEAITKSGVAGSKIVFTGRLDHKAVCRWYQIADIALFPSYYEECSYVGIEMMMHGLPVVASDGYSVKNMFHDGVNARIAKIENWKKTQKFEENLRQTIVEVLHSDLSELRKSAEKMYRSKYSIEKMQQGYLELLNVLSQRVVIVQLAGGLGNQMYRYANGKALAESKNAKLIVDTRFFDSAQENTTPREYELSAFELQVDMLNDATLAQLLAKLNVYKEKLWYKYDEKINDVKLPCLLMGHWQSEKYFKSAEELLRRDFRIKDSCLSPEVKKLGMELSETPSSVSIHVRRTDYAVYPHCILPLHYYQRAVDYMQDKLTTPSFYVFSDDPDWVEQHFDIPVQFQVVKGFSGIEDMYLMSQCRHNIIANSTFSWWAAWLNQNQDKIVIAPKDYLFDTSLDVENTDILPPEWICVW